jgi:hypothetical protein
MSDTKVNRGVRCPGCGRTINLRLDGTMVIHRVKLEQLGLCTGSSSTVESVWMQGVRS